jgi:hypothetical protein
VDEAEAEAEAEEGVDQEAVPQTLVSGDAGKEGYAKYELSADGNRVHIAVQEVNQKISNISRGDDG